MAKNAKQFLFDEILSYYRYVLMPDLYCLGVRGDRFLGVLEELAHEIPPEITLEKQQQKKFCNRLIDIAIEMFEADRISDLKIYKKRLKNYLLKRS
ncbi:MAG: hypothetical protein MUD14_15040 [Hydrococcus sp. Prado102]|jgi:hypothetical protein|nr:hypothetical protein [Hydrococcus sp. Prado102]